MRKLFANYSHFWQWNYKNELIQKLLCIDYFTCQKHLKPSQQQHYVFGTCHVKVKRWLSVAWHDENPGLLHKGSRHKSYIPRLACISSDCWSSVKMSRPFSVWIDKYFNCISDNGSMFTTLHRAAYNSKHIYLPYLGSDRSRHRFWKLKYLSADTAETLKSTTKPANIPMQTHRML